MIIPTSLDSTTAYIKLGNSITQILAVYKSLWKTLKSQYHDSLTNFNGLFLIAGNLNAKHSNWHCIFPKKAGKTLVQHEDSANRYSIIASEFPTHYPFIAAHQSNVLDIMLIKSTAHHAILNQPLRPNIEP